MINGNTLGYSFDRKFAINPVAKYRSNAGIAHRLWVGNRFSSTLRPKKWSKCPWVT